MSLVWKMEVLYIKAIFIRVTVPLFHDLLKEKEKGKCQNDHWMKTTRANHRRTKGSHSTENNSGEV